MSAFTSNDGSAKVRRIDVHEQQLAVLEELPHSFDRALAAQPAQIPDQIGLRGDLEHHLGAAHAAHGSARERLVAEHLLVVGDDDRVVLDVESAVAKRFAQVGDFLRLLAVLEALRRVRCFPHPAIDLPLETELGIVDDQRAPDEDIEQRGDVLAVNALDLRRHRVLESGGQLGDLRIGGGGRIVLRHVEENEIVVVGERDHQLRRGQRELLLRKSRIASPVVSSTLSSFSQP